MPEPENSPFIPPLPEMPNGSPVRPPVIPMSPPQQTPQPSLAGIANPQYLAPYGTPYGYGMAGMGLPVGGQTPGPPPSAGLRSGFSPDYVGYPNGPPPPAGASPHVPPAGTPYGAVPMNLYPPPHGPPPPPPAHGQPPPHPGHAAYPQAAYPAFMYPGTAYNAFQAPLPGMPYPPPGGAGYPWPPPTGPPGMPPGIYATPAPAGYPGLPGYYPGAPPAAPPPGFGAPAPARNSRASRGDRYDLVFQFKEGVSYGPALKPAHVQALGVQLHVNPLLKPVEDSDSTERKHLIWNMLFSSSDCRLSGDAVHRSWSAGREEPATWPRVTHLRLISSAFPWMVDINAKDPAVGVTCGDLIDQLCGYLHVRLRKEDYNSTTPEQQRLLKSVYHYNRSRADGVPGGRLGDGLKRIDWLDAATMFGGVCVNDPFVVMHCGIAFPCTLEVRCLERSEGPEPEVSELRARGQSRSRRGSRASSLQRPAE